MRLAHLLLKPPQTSKYETMVSPVMLTYKNFAVVIILSTLSLIAQAQTQTPQLPAAGWAQAREADGTCTRRVIQDVLVFDDIVTHTKSTVANVKASSANLPEDMRALFEIELGTIMQKAIADGYSKFGAKYGQFTCTVKNSTLVLTGERVLADFRQAMEALLPSLTLLSRLPACPTDLNDDYMRTSESLNEIGAVVMDFARARMNNSISRAEELKAVQLIKIGNSLYTSFRAKHAGQYFCTVTSRDGIRGIFDSKEMDRTMEGIQKSFEGLIKDENLKK